ncbi:MAG: glycosyltransferase 4 family protein [Nanoarchaeota archaeon]
MALAILSFIVSFLAVLIATPIWIRRTKKIGLLGKDIHKKDREVAEAGGIVVVFATLIGISIYIFINTFVTRTDIHLIEVLGITVTFLLAGFIGFIDDILGWKVGLRQVHKFLLSILIAIPLVVLNAGTSEMTLPFIGLVDLGLIYPLVVVPIGILFVTNSFNMIAGYNGLEAGMGVIILATLSLLTFNAGAFWAAAVALIAAFALLAFLLFNKYPAQVFPGDTLTYSIGALIAAVAITGNAEKAALILFLPYIAEFILKARGKFVKESFAKVNRDGTLEMPYEKIYSLTHEKIWLLKKLKKRVYERDIVYSLWLTELVLALIAIFIS